MRRTASLHGLERCVATGKIAHPHYPDAARHAKSMADRVGRRPRDFVVYRCRRCDGFHVARKQKRR